MLRALTLLLFLAAACSTPAATPSASTPEPMASDETMTTAAPTASAAATVPTATPAVPPAWSELAATGPAAREDHTWIVGGDGTTAYLFGGRDGGSVHGDLWAFDFATDAWSQLQPTGAAPAPRFGHEAAWAEGIGLVVVFGQAGPSFFNDLWAYDPETNAWRELAAAGDVPVARYGSCAALGPDGRLWISHGFTSDGVRFADTVAYDFATATWTDETPTGARPVERCLHGCWWTDDGALALFGGQTTGTTALGDSWRLDPGAGWSEPGGDLPPAVNLYAHARLGDATLVFGGQTLDGGYAGELWRFADAATGATPMTVDGPAPSPRSGATMVHDPAGDRLLLFGGRDASGAFDDVWTLGPASG